MNLKEFENDLEIESSNRGSVSDNEVRLLKVVKLRECLKDMIALQEDFVGRTDSTSERIGKNISSLIEELGKV